MTRTKKVLERYCWFFLVLLHLLRSKLRSSAIKLYGFQSSFRFGPTFVWNTPRNPHWLLIRALGSSADGNVAQSNEINTDQYWSRRSIQRYRYWSGWKSGWNPSILSRSRQSCLKCAEMIKYIMWVFEPGKVGIRKYLIHEFRKNFWKIRIF